MHKVKTKPNFTFVSERVLFIDLFEKFVKSYSEDGNKSVWFQTVTWSLHADFHSITTKAGYMKVA